MHLRFSRWHQFLLLFNRSFRLSELLGSIAVFAAALQVCRLLYFHRGALEFDREDVLYNVMLVAGLVLVLGSSQVVYWLFLLYGIGRNRRPTVADLPDRIWVLVGVETGLMPMTDDGIHAVAFELEAQAAPWLAQAEGTMIAECVDRDRTLATFRDCGVKSLVYYRGGPTRWVVLSLSQ
jgi:hypothetical protein